MSSVSHVLRQALASVMSTSQFEGLPEQIFLDALDLTPSPYLVATCAQTGLKLHLGCSHGWYHDTAGNHKNICREAWNNLPEAERAAYIEVKSTISLSSNANKSAPASVVESLYAVKTRPQAVQITPEEQSKLVFDMIQYLLITVVQKIPVLLVIEDPHHLDVDAAKLVAAICTYVAILEPSITLL